MINERIKQLRIAAGMTQDDVVGTLAANGVSLTKGGLSKYECGGSTPKPTMLRELAHVFGVEAAYFFDEPNTQLRWLAFRKGAKMGKKKQQRVKTLAEGQVDLLLTLQWALEPAVTTCQTPYRFKVTKPEDAEHAAESLRKHWQLGEQPIKSVTTTIENCGGIVVESGSNEDLFDGLSGWANESIPVIAISGATSDDRRRFSLAHELGHLFMDVGCIDKKTEEKLAHRFAAAFLVTASTARRELGINRRHLDLKELAILKQKHGLSMQAWIMRAVDLHIIEPSRARTLFSEMSSRGWRRTEPVTFEGREQPKKLHQLTVRALAEGIISRSQGEKIYPGVTRDIEDKETIGELDARSLVLVPKNERDQLMKQAAHLISEEYEERGNLFGFDSLCEKDHSDESIAD